MTDKEDKILPSVIFSDDATYEKHLRNTITLLDGCILRGEDVLIEAPMATRVLLDFYYETLRRHLEYGRNREKDSVG